MMTTDVPESAPATVPPGPPARAGRGWSRRRLAILALLVLAAGAAAGWWLFGQTYHYAVVDPGVLYRDGNQSLWRFKQSVRRARPKTVVCLVDDDEVAS